MPEAGFRCYRCHEFVRAEFEEDPHPDAPPAGYLGDCPNCGATNHIRKPSWGPQGVNNGEPASPPEPEERAEALYDGRASLVEHLRNILEPTKRDVRAFLSDQGLPEDLFKTASNIWNCLDRALQKANKELT